MTTHEIKTIQDFHFPTSVVEEKILAAYPGAVTVLDYVVQHRKLSVGDLVVNHHEIPPMVITKEMLENHFPSLNEAILWYRLPQSQQAFSFIKDLKVNGDDLKTCDPDGRLKVQFDPETGFTHVSGKTERTEESYNFTFQNLETLYSWLKIINNFHTYIYSLLMLHHIVCETKTGIITGVHKTLHLCDEDASDQIRRHRRALTCRRIYTPWGMRVQDIIGKNVNLFDY